MEVTLIIAAAVVLLMNVWATILVSRSTFLIKARRQWQVIFIWFLPIIGSALAIYFNTESVKSPEQKRGHHPPGSEADGYVDGYNGNDYQSSNLGGSDVGSGGGGD